MNKYKVDVTGTSNGSTDLAIATKQEEKGIFVYSNKDKNIGYIIKSSKNKSINIDFEKKVDKKKIKVYAVDYDKLVAFKSRRDELNITSLLKK